MPVVPAEDTTPFPARALRELDALRGDVTPAGWLREHPGDHLVRAEDDPGFGSRSDVPLEGLWCVSAVRKERLPGGPVFVRTAYFYPPLRPFDAIRDGSDTPSVGEPTRRCRLAAIEVALERDLRDTDRGGWDRVREELAALTQRTAGHFTRALGEPARDEAYGDWAARSREHRARWRTGDRTILAGYEGVSSSVRVLAWKPLSGIDPWGRSEPVPVSNDSTLPGTIARVGGLDSAAAAPLIALHQRAVALAREDGRNRWSDSALIAVLRDWVPAAGGLEPRPRAARLLLADRLLGATYGVSGGWDAGESAVRRELRAIGADFESWPITGDSGYAGNWLWQAYRADSAGPVGELAALLLLERGWDTHLACRGGTELFLNVIREGTRLLPRLSNDRARAAAHLAVARAWGDIVAGATPGTVLAGYVEPDSFRARAPEARRRALEHYRSAFRLLDRGRTAHRARQEAWRLAAGLAPLGTWFVCIYD